MLEAAVVEARLRARSICCGWTATTCEGCRCHRKAALQKLLGRMKGGIQYVAHAHMPGDEAFQAACDLGIEGIVSKRLTAPYKSGPCKSWIKVRNPKSPAPADHRRDVLREAFACARVACFALQPGSQLFNH